MKKRIEAPHIHYLADIPIHEEAFKKYLKRKESLRAKEATGIENIQTNSKHATRWGFAPRRQNMMKPPVKSGGDFEPLPAGSYAARLYSIVFIGTVPIEWEGKTKYLDKVRMTFEFPTETKVFKEENGEQPYVLSTEFTWSLSKKANLRKFLEGWQGKTMTEEEAADTDVQEWVGREGLANVVHTVSQKNGSTYANISSMSPLPKGMTCPPPVNPQFLLDYQDNWDQDRFDSLPEFLQEKMMDSDQYKEKFGIPSNNQPVKKELGDEIEELDF